MNTKQKLGLSLVLSALLFSEANAGITGNPIVLTNQSENAISITVTNDDQNSGLYRY